VLQHLDAATLCTAVPLVCREWSSASRHPRVWLHRCDPQLVQSLHPALGLPATRCTPGGAPGPASPSRRNSSDQASARNGGGNSLARRISLPLLHHAGVCPHSCPGTPTPPPPPHPLRHS
jgi:hypothetical protein